MLFSSATLTAVAAFLPGLVSAHCRMVYPPSVFTHNEGLDLNPLNPDGSNYPCFYTDGGSGEIPSYDPGSTQYIGLEGSAVHGGGSCQISITYDNPPTKDSKFKVLKSFEGACPGGQDTNQNLPADPTHVLPQLPFEVPKDIPSGGAVIAWSWFNKIGNREMYMRCAPVKITGQNTDKSAFEALPDIFKANIGNGCGTLEGTNVIFPNPGTQLVIAGEQSNLHDPQGTCDVAGPQPQPQPDFSTPTPTSVKPVLVKVPSSTPAATSTPTTPENTATTSCSSSTEAPTPTPNSNVQEQKQNSTCTDGQIYCTGSDTFSICNFGKLVPFGEVAAGTYCKDGHISMRRSVRFSHEHRRRHKASVL